MMRPLCQDTISQRAGRRGVLWICAIAVLAALLATWSTSAHATSISFGFTTEFSGATPPSGTAPWLTATFDDEGTPGTVKLTFTATNLTGGEYVSAAHFNLNTTYNATTALSFSAPTKTGSFSDPAVNLGVDSFMADGDGNYDILLDFANGGGANSRFGAGESVEYLITGIGAAAGALVATDFQFLSAPAGGHGPFYVAAHVQGIGAEGNDSGWVTAPEPTTFTLAALAALALLRRR